MSPDLEKIFGDYGLKIGGRNIFEADSTKPCPAASLVVMSVEEIRSFEINVAWRNYQAENRRTSNHNLPIYGKPKIVQSTQAKL